MIVLILDGERDKSSVWSPASSTCPSGLLLPIGSNSGQSLSAVILAVLFNHFYFIE